eukprot:2270633-Rhodomonas_salina.1
MLAARGAGHTEIKYKKPQYQYNLYQECGMRFLGLDFGVYWGRRGLTSWKRGHASKKRNATSSAP